MTVAHMVAEGGRVATRKMFRGTHRGSCWAPPTGKRVTIGLIDTVRLVIGDLVWSWSEGDNLNRLQQPYPSGLR